MNMLERQGWERGASISKETFYLKRYEALRQKGCIFDKDCLFNSINIIQVD